MFTEVVGHSAPKKYLEKALREERLPHTMLFEGPDGVGKKKLALSLAAHLLGTRPEKLPNHPDFHMVVPEGKVGLHSTETLKKAMEEAEKAPFQASVKVFVIDSAERMQPAHSNALLKTLEEPPPNTVWVLVTSALGEILPTIVSRCAHVQFQPLTGPEVIQVLSGLGVQGRGDSGSVARALEFVQFPQLAEAENLLTGLLKQQTPYPQLLKTLDQIEKLIDTEDPLLYNRRVHALFAAIYAHFREVEATSVQRWVTALQKAQLGFERNLKLTHCLEAFCLHVQVG